MSQITERGILVSVAIASVWALLFTIGVMTGWFAPWWLWISVAVTIFMGGGEHARRTRAKKQEGAPGASTDGPMPTLDLFHLKRGRGGGVEFLVGCLVGLFVFMALGWGWWALIGVVVVVVALFAKLRQ